jgi:hypothetical protein
MGGSFTITKEKIDSSRAAEELARSLEKNGLLKVTGDGIKWMR